MYARTCEFLHGCVSHLQNRGTHREQEWVIFSNDIELSRGSTGAPAVWNGPSNSSPADVLRAKGAARTESWNVEVRRVPATAVEPP